MITVYQDEERFKRIYSRLKEVYDPELGVNIIDLGLVYEIHCEEPKDVKVVMTLTTPGCPMHDMMVGGIRRALGDFDDVGEIDVQVVWDPRWSPAMMSDEAKEQLSF